MNWYAERDGDADDALRMRKAELQLEKITVQRLQAVKERLTHEERGALADFDFRVCVMGELLCGPHLAKLKALAWKYRRLLPAHMAPKLPPHDPIVMEMEANR